jgi:hypothetical protein
MSGFEGYFSTKLGVDEMQARSSSLQRGGFFARLPQAIRRLWRGLRPAGTRYRPEKHYMRGPGPKSGANKNRSAGSQKGARGTDAA